MISQATDKYIFCYFIHGLAATPLKASRGSNYQKVYIFLPKTKLWIFEYSCLSTCLMCRHQVDSLFVLLQSKELEVFYNRIMVEY